MSPVTEEDTPPDRCKCCGNPVGYMVGHAILVCLDCSKCRFGGPHKVSEKE